MHTHSPRPCYFYRKTPAVRHGEWTERGEEAKAATAKAQKNKREDTLHSVNNVRGLIIYIKWTGTSLLLKTEKKAMQVQQGANKQEGKTESERRRNLSWRTKTQKQNMKKMSTTFASNIRLDRREKSKQHFSDQAQERHKGERSPLPLSGWPRQTDPSDKTWLLVEEALSCLRITCCLGNT